MAKLTLEEKKLEKIRLQLFGKQQNNQSKIKTVHLEKNISAEEITSTIKNSTPSIHILEGTFLKRDLVKVLILSTAAIGTQFLLYYLSLKGIIHLSMFHIF